MVHRDEIRKNVWHVDDTRYVVHSGCMLHIKGRIFRADILEADAPDGRRRYQWSLLEVKSVNGKPQLRLVYSGSIHHHYECCIDAAGSAVSLVEQFVDWFEDVPADDIPSNSWNPILIDQETADIILTTI